MKLREPDLFPCKKITRSLLPQKKPGTGLP
jgi:hypothetical protein